jgi:O-antigen ligase
VTSTGRATAGPLPSPVRRHRSPRRSALSNANVLTAAAVILFVVPQRLAVGPAGLRFSTISLLGLVALFAWSSRTLRLIPGTRLRFNPVRVALTLFAVWGLFSFAIANSRILSPLESNGATRSLVATMASLGLALLLCDGGLGPRDIRRVVTGLLAGAYFSAVIAVAQRFFGLNYAQLWSNVPLLHAGGEGELLESLMSGRATGTANHPIELSVASAVLIGVAVHHSVTSSSARLRRLHAIGAILLVFGTLLAISRSGFVALVIVGILTIRQVDRSQRLTVVVLGILTMAVTQITARGVLATLRYQLLNTGDDASSQGRTDDYGPVFELVSQRPWLGMGNGTFVPEQYLYLDNAWLGILLGGGFVGVMVTLLLIATALYTSGVAERPARSATGRYERGLAATCRHALIALAVSALFFDEFSFPQTAALFFFMIGILGALFSALSAGSGTAEVSRA